MEQSDSREADISSAILEIPRIYPCYEPDDSSSRHFTVAEIYI
jgi:hypothetical protein